MCADPIPPTTKAKLRDPLEIINSASRLKIKANPEPEMGVILDAAENCLRHHPTLAVDVWRRSIKEIRTALECIEDIYDADCPRDPADPASRREEIY